MKKKLTVKKKIDKKKVGLKKKHYNIYVLLYDLRKKKHHNYIINLNTMSSRKQE